MNILEDLILPGAQRPMTPIERELARQLATARQQLAAATAERDEANNLLRQLLSININFH